MSLRCTVRGCGEPLRREARAWRCGRGHGFDIAASGYVNLLQPQDRRSRAAGDSRATALARRRLAAAGADRPLVERLASELSAHGGERTRLLDLGCGEGSALAALAARRPLEGWGLDLSAAAIDLAARAAPALGWAVANADRGLPFDDESFDWVLSLTARRPGAEIARVLAPEGRLLLAVPAPDDRRELRAAVQGEAHERERLERAEAELRPWLRLERRERLSWRLRLDAAGVADLLATTYLGARPGERERAARLATLDLTCSRDLGWFCRADRGARS